MNSCRVCGSQNVFDFLDLGSQPLANAVLTKVQYANERFYPLILQFCENCGLVQLKNLVPPKILFEEYAYFTDKASEEWKKHLSEFAHLLEKEFNIRDNHLVVDIGSNDGTLLKNFRCKVVGIDPAKNVAEQAKKDGIPTIIDYFTVQTADKIANNLGSAKLVLATNTFAHLQDLYEVFSALKVLLSDDGAFVVEIPHFLELFKNLEFDTIYHEHSYYFLLKPLIQLGNMFKIPLFKVEKLSTHGGSLRLYFEKKRPIENSVFEVLEEEQKAGMYQKETYITFTNKVNLLKETLVSILKEIKGNNQTICGYGHPAKATVLLNYCELKRFIDYIKDDTPYKQGKFSPGTHIPIVSSKEFHEHPTNYALMFAWNYKKEILETEKDFIKNGGKFIIPIPEVKVIP